MMNALKKFIKQHFDSHPLFWTLQQKRYDRICDRHSRMSYAEIEAAIGRKYEKVFGRKLNWDNPQTYNEKIHVSKLYMPSELKTRLADKYLVREWISEKIGEEYLIPLLGVYDSFDEIDFDALPDRFVIKCNHDSGSYTFCRDKSKLNKKLLKRKYDTYVNRNYGWNTWEMHYIDMKPKIMIEPFVGDGTMCDYKFMCFGEKAYYCQVFFDLNTGSENHKGNFYDMEWNLIDCCCPKWMTKDYSEHECPDKWQEMKELAEKLSEGFDQVRVDLCLIGSKILFGEMTFADANGFAPFVPDEWDYKFGALWPFDNSVRKKILAQSSRPKIDNGMKTRL